MCDEFIFGEARIFSVKLPCIKLIKGSIFLREKRVPHLLEKKSQICIAALLNPKNTSLTARIVLA